MECIQDSWRRFERDFKYDLRELYSFLNSNPKLLWDASKLKDALQNVMYGIISFCRFQVLFRQPFDTFLHVQADRQERANSVQFKPKVHTWAGFGNIVNNECLVLCYNIHNSACCLVRKHHILIRKASVTLQETAGVKSRWHNCHQACEILLSGYYTAGLSHN